MSHQHKLQANRFELKYIVSPRSALALRDFARSYLEHDEHADPALDFAYAIHSIYLDSPSLALAHATLQGHKNRFKLRVRYYDDHPDHPVFFEIKRRVNDAILKQRAAVRRSSVARLLDGHWPERSDLIDPESVKAYESLKYFCELRDRIRGKGRVIVSYHREAWVSPNDDAARLTFDRHLIATPFTGELVVPDFAEGLKPEVAGVILELKFTDRFPTWMRNMVHIFNLQRTSMPKYVECLQMLRPRRYREELQEEAKAAL